MSEMPEVPVHYSDKVPKGQLKVVFGDFGKLYYVEGRGSTFPSFWLEVEGEKHLPFAFWKVKQWEVKHLSSDDILVKKYRKALKAK